MTADSQRDLAAGALDLVGELHAGGRGADDQDAAVGQIVGTPVVRGRHLPNVWRETAARRGNRGPIAVAGRHDDGRGRRQHTAIGDDAEAVTRRVDALNGRVASECGASDAAA